MSIDHEARAILFQSMIGEAPLPTRAAVAQAQVYLRGDAEFCAALDEVVSIILINQRAMGKEDWRDRLQAYIAAQLDGRAYIHEFADVRRALDASVALAEEYALLYETMAREWQGTLPEPVDIPPLNFSALNLPLPSAPEFDAPTPATTLPNPHAGEVTAISHPALPLPSLGKRWFTRVKPAWQTFSVWLNVDKCGSVVQPIMVCLLMLAFVAGLWLTTQPRATSSIVRPTARVETVKPEDAFSKMQIQLETPLPPVIKTTQSGPVDDDYYGCRFLRLTTFARSACKL